MSRTICKLKILPHTGEVERRFEGDELAFNFTRSDVGRYRCSSENKLAKIEKVIRIGIYGRCLGGVVAGNGKAFGLANRSR